MTELPLRIVYLQLSMKLKRSYYCGYSRMTLVSTACAASAGVVGWSVALIAGRSIRSNHANGLVVRGRFRHFSFSAAATRSFASVSIANQLAVRVHDCIGGCASTCIGGCVAVYMHA